VAYPLDNALYQWEEGYRRLRELSEDPQRARRLARVVEAVRDELRRRIGATFTANELAELYGRGTDWCLEAARRAAPLEAAELDPQAITDGAFYLHLRGAADYAGGRLIPTE
jgi:DNA-directed RNA polymerase specialized sigma subunit